MVQESLSPWICFQYGSNILENDDLYAREEVFQLTFEAFWWSEMFKLTQLSKNRMHV